MTTIIKQISNYNKYVYKNPHSDVQYPSDARYNARAFRTRAARVSRSDCTRVALRLHACHKLIARVSHAFDMGAEKRVCPGGPLASVRAFARRGRTRVFGLLCYDHASTTSCKTTTILVLPSMTTPQLQDLFGLL